MKRRWSGSCRKCLALIIAFAVIACIGCSDKDNKQNAITELKSGDVISTDFPWFNSSKVEFDIDYEKQGDIEQLEFENLGVTADYVVLHSYGRYDPSRDMSEKAIDDIIFVDMNSWKEVYRTSLTDYRPDNGCVEKVILAAGKAWIKSGTDYLTIDPATKDVSKVESDGNEVINADWSCCINDLSYCFTYHFDDLYYTMNVADQFGTVNTCEIKPGNVKIYEIRFLLALDKDRILLSAFTDSGYKYFVYDPKTNDITDKTSSYDWINDLNTDDMRGLSGGQAGMINDHSIAILDMDKHCMSEMFNKYWSDVYIPNLKRTSILEAEDNTITLLDFKNKGKAGSIIENVCIYKFNRAEKNPNAGKNVIELCFTDDTIPEAVNEAVSFYNSEPNGCFIIASERFKPENADGSDESDMSAFETSQQLSEQLSVDILAGDGPDMFIGRNPLTGLENDKCLVDLTETARSLSQDKYFTNIINSVDINGKIYRIPLFFDIIGIQTDAEKAGISSDGLTMEEWHSFVYDYCNGNDPLPLGKSLYLTVLFNNMYDVFCSDNSVVIDCPEFRELVDYCFDNVPEEYVSYEDYDESLEYSRGLPAIFSSMSGVGDYYGNIGNIEGKGTDVIGLPSTDRRGPACITYSVSVSAGTSYPKECEDFIRLLLSDDYQTLLTDMSGNVVNRSAYENACADILQYHTSEQETDRMTQQDVDNYTKVIEKISHQYNPGDTAALIISEEIPPYFNKHKSYDEVIRIISNRIATVTAERGA